MTELLGCSTTRQTQKRAWCASQPQVLELCRSSGCCVCTQERKSHKQGMTFLQALFSEVTCCGCSIIEVWNTDNFHDYLSLPWILQVFHTWLKYRSHIAGLLKNNLNKLKTRNMCHCMIGWNKWISDVDTQKLHDFICKGTFYMDTVLYQAA